MDDSIIDNIYNTNDLAYETFIYDRKETQIIEGVLGENLTLTCSNPTTSQVNWTNQSIVWYRLPGLKINGQTSPELCIDKLTNDDLGTYFCSEYSMSLHRHLPVRKIEIWSNNFMSEINLGELIHDENLIYFQCPNVLNEYTFVIWEYPKGHIIVNEYNYQLKPVVPQLHHTKQILPICQYSWMNEWNTTIDQETYLRRVRRSSESTPYITISRRIDPDDPTVILQCHMPPNEAQTASFNYQWSTIESGKIGDSETIVRQIIVDHVPDDGVKRDTSITCEVTSSETGEVIGSITLDLEPKSLSTTGKMELSETTTEIFSYRNGDTLELHCELEKDFIGTGENVIWKFNGGTLPTGANRLDKLKTSIIVIKKMGNIHEGLYECQQNSKKLRGHILRAPTIVTLTVLPKEDERWANANDITEFHCRLDGRENGNQLIDWYFIPAGSDDDREIPLHNDVKIDNPDTTPSTSFLSIMNVQKYHEGFYVCRALNLKDTAKLIVKIRDLTVTPEEVKARPGTTVQFLCELSTITGMKGGKVFWMRTDRQDLRSGKEEVIGTNGGRALLIVKDVGRFDHNISYMCTDGYSKGYAKLYVQEVCAPGFRPCGSQQCLEETKFCDGVVDCEDGYDEIPSKCTPSDYDQCNGTHYTCPQGDKMIARAFMCDSVPDCEPNGDDESECSYPSIIEPSGETHLIGHQSGNLTLTCVAYGRPPPTISWRYNWGHLREGVKHSINYTVINCNMAISHLTLTDLEPRASGLYTCEAVNRGRALAPDFLVNVAKGGICKAPQFNDAAWFDDMCLTCYCSNVTDTCTSVKDGSIEEGQGITEIDGDILRIPDVPNESTFIESDFNLSGSWSTDQSIYWCPPNDRLLVHTIPTGYDNRIHIRLSERDKWFIDKECKQKIDQTIGRAGFMQIISDIKKIGFRVKYFRDQTTLELFNIKVEHAVKSDVPGQWVGEIEECTCPNGYEGLSCEKCAPGYQKDPDNPLKCRPFCACDKCDTEGNCIECPGKRAGPRCQQCQDGYYRPDKSLLATDCQPCDMCGNNLPYVVKKCHFNPQADDDYFCKCRISEDNKLLNPTCDRCQLAIDRGDELPDDAKCDTKPQPMDCHYYGTQLTSDNGDCQCKEDSAGFGFDIWLGQRTEMGGLQRKDYTTNGNQRIEREMDNFYKYIYGGKMSFKIDSIKLNPNELTQREASVIVELESGVESVTIDTKSRRIIVKLREPINLLCKATSYRGGLVTHEWITPNNEYSSQSIISRQYLAKPDYYNRVNLTTYQSETILQIKFAKQEDAGEYTYAVSLPDVPEDDEINRKFPLPIPPIHDPPSLTVYEIKKDPDNSQITLIGDDIINPPAEVTVPFMQPYIVQVRTKPGKEDISVTWKKIGPLPETITEKKDDDVKTLDSDSTLPEGTSQDKTNLNIWAAAEQHEGIYEGTVVRDRDGVEVKRIQTIIRVQPMTSGSKTELGLAEAAEPIESEVGDDDDQEEKEPPAWDFIVGGFTPDAKHCENPTWTIVDYQLNKTTDITDKVIRTSDENFRVNYPLTSGLYLRFQCKPIPKSNLTGEIKFNISSPDPRIILKPIYDNPDSTFPTRLHAITSTEQKFIIRKGDIPPIRRLEMDWRRIGEFDPFNNDGYFTCFVNNTETNGSKTIKLPSDKVPIQLPEDPFTRLYIYSPDTYVVPELDGSAKIMIPEGEQLRIYCVFEARPSNEFHGWRGTTSEIENNIKIEHRIYSSLAQTDKANLSLDGQKLECVYGERSKPLEISVIPKDERKLHAKILSDAFINDRLVGITGSDMNLTCDVKHTTRKPATIDKIDWYVQYPNGIRRDIKHTQLADSLSTGPKGEWIYFTKLTEKPQGLNIFCVVRLEDIQKATQAYYSSPHISLWIREPKVLVSIEGQDHLGIITGIETQTAQIKCIVKDAWRNKTVEEADIAWETKITSIQEELSNNNNERARPQPSPKDLPMLGAKALYDTMVIAGLRRQPNWIARFRCKGTDLKTGAYGYSDFVKLEVLPGDTLEQVPKLRLISHTDPNSPYPNKVECIDDNQNYESQVTWTRQDEPIDPAQITTTPNNAVLKWTHNGMDKFDPRIDAGIYTCRSVNPYSSSVKQVYIPYDLMVTDYETPITPEVRILSNVNEIFQDSGDRYLICTFYGHPPPEGGLQWSIDRFNGTRNSLSSHWLSMQGLVIQSGRHYWTTIGSPQFDALGRHTGVFQCTALNSIGQIIERDQVRVELHKVYVRINELSESGLIENQKGSNGTITCNAYDGYLQFILPDATYTWEVERINGERVHPNLIADQIEMNHNQLHYYGLSPTANKLRIRCIALNDTARYISSDFSFRVFGSDKGEPMKISDIEPGGTKWISGGGEERITLKIGGKNDLTNHVTIKDGENVQLNCTAYVLTDGNLHFGWRLLGVYGETVPEAGLTRQSVQSYTIDDGNTGVLIIEDARPSSNLPQPSARIQCLATSYNDGVTYYSTLVDLIVYPEEIPVDHVKDVKDREKLNRLSVSVIGLDDRGRLSGTEGSSVKLECIATDRSTKQRTKESVLYGWEFSRLDGTPVDTTSLIGVGDSRLEVNENHLILQGLKQTTSILGRCRVIVPLEESHDEDAQLSRTEEIFYSPHFRFDIIDSDGTGRRDFIAPIQPIIPTKDSDIFIKVDGLDENGALSANKGDSVELKCIAMSKQV
ncbi:hypothetical protein Smp_146950 [Schistosoma mansoni]|uniref:hypothetical protein n=1 Tax=Schistosoma mansoni TaxID=6183 RepID=UPI00022DC4B2|nr:hypothetical protein Smp_146950 [Schistosoma mansoni]|eukprot:XP_018650637.1 hypothetical protein Smp_146950 [Schistosoma mansoni]